LRCFYLIIYKEEEKRVKAPGLRHNLPSRDILNSLIGRLYNRVPIDHPEDTEIEEYLNLF
jgi:hypothetical protein